MLFVLHFDLKYDILKKKFVFQINKILEIISKCYVIA